VCFARMRLVPRSLCGPSATHRPMEQPKGKSPNAQRLTPIWPLRSL